MDGRDINYALLDNPVKIPDWWKSREDQIQDFLNNDIVLGMVETIALTPGGRKVSSVTYGVPEPELRGKANFNSAIAAGDPDAYYRRGTGVRKRPVLVILAGIHGQEVEGMMGAVSIVKVMESGKNLMGNDCAILREKLLKLRLIIIPMANPDGRSRIPYDGWCGFPDSEMHKWGQGTTKDGKLYNWPYCKAIHPMKGDVGILGGYFDDAGINIMHDEWSLPMSQVTRAILDLARTEGPDMLINLHGYDLDPGILTTHYVPSSVSRQLVKLAEKYFNNLEKAGYKHLDLPYPVEEGINGMPPPFNLDSMLYHTGVELGFVHEIPQGLSGNPTLYEYSDLLQIHHILIETAADYLLDR